MRFIIITCVIILAAGSLAAASFTLDNNIHPTGQYTSWTAAYNAAAEGDTIYVYPSPYNYGSFDVAKRLTVIGGGVNPANPGLIDSKISLYVGSGSAAGEDCLFSGLQIVNGVTNNYRVKYSNCRFNSWVTLKASNSELYYCWIVGNVIVGDGSTPSNGFLVCGCTIEGYFRPASQTDATCANCVFIGNVNHIDTFVNNQINCYFTNCLYANSGTGSHTLAMVYSSPVSLVFVNCIMGIITIHAGYTFQYCIFEGSSPNITGPGNQQNVDLAEVMVDVNGGDYHLIPGSLASGTGINGEDIGIYGGGTPFNDLWYLTRLPSITEFTCPIVVDPSGFLNVHIEAQVGN